MTYYSVYYFQIKFIHQGLLASSMQFKYEGFEWVTLLPEPILQGMLFLMLISGVLITIGVWMRPAAIYYTLALTYFMLVEKAYYNNHIYLFILLFFLLIFTHADRFLSASGNKGIGSNIPRWQVFIFQFQISIVYFYGGLAKLHPDWLFHQEPMRTMVTQYIGYQNELLVQFLSFGGLLLDLGAPLVFFYKPLRKWGMVPIALFHIINSQMFNDIGIFPYVMLASLVLFFEANELPWWRNETTKPANTKPVKQPIKKLSIETVSNLLTTPNWTKWVLGIYFVLQLLIPFRCFFLPNNPNYTTIGNRFSWRMKIDTRDTEEVSFFIKNSASGEERQVKVNTYLNPMQITLLTVDPRAAIDFAQHLKSIVEKKGGATPIIKAKIKFGYNGRAHQYFVDPEADLSILNYSAFKKLDVVIPIQ